MPTDFEEERDYALLIARLSPDPEISAIYAKIAVECATHMNAQRYVKNTTPPKTAPGTTSTT